MKKKILTIKLIFHYQETRESRDVKMDFNP